MSSFKRVKRRGDGESAQSHSPLVFERNHVDDENPQREQKPSGGFEPERRADVSEERANVHRVIEDVEGESGDSVRHEDTEVVSEVCTWY